MGSYTLKVFIIHNNQSIIKVIISYYKSIFTRYINYISTTTNMNFTIMNLALVLTLLFVVFTTTVEGSDSPRTQLPYTMIPPSEPEETHIPYYEETQMPQPEETHIPYYEETHFPYETQMPETKEEDTYNTFLNVPEKYNTFLN